MSRSIDITDAVRLLCYAAHIEPSSVQHIGIHGGYISFELKDGTAVVFLTEGEDDDGCAA